MADDVLTPDTTVQVPLRQWWKTALAIAGLVAAAYTARDRIMADVRTIVKDEVRVEREARVEAQAHLLQKEEFYKAIGELKTLIIERTK